MLGLDYDQSVQIEIGSFILNTRNNIGVISAISEDQKVEVSYRTFKKWYDIQAIGSCLTLID